MTASATVPRLCFAATMLLATAAHAGAPQPDTRQGGYAHVCQGGANKAQSCTVATQDVDCPGSTCVPITASRPIAGTLTIVAHDAVADWGNGGNGSGALTLLLEVKAPDGSRQLLAATYQNLLSPLDPPTAPGTVVSVPIDEAGVRDLAAAVGGLLFAQPESTVAQRLRELFGSTGVPALVAVKDRQVLVADHTGDGLATVLRFKVKLQFLEGI